MIVVIYLYHNLVNNREETGFLNNEEDARMLAATLIAGIELAQLDHVKTWNPNHSDHAFITTMGIDVLTFEFIFTSGFASLWYHKSITCPDTNSQGIPCLNCCSLNAGGALGLMLHYLNSTMHETSLQQIFTLIPTTVSCYLTSGLPILLQTLHSMCCSALVVACHSHLEGAFGSIDGLKLPVQTSHDVDIENTTYNGWFSKHFVSSVIAFSAEGVVIAARTNVPRSWHNSCVASRIYTKLHLNTPPGYYIITDTVFPHGMTSVDGHIYTPLKHGQVLHGSAAKIEEHMVFNCQLLSYCQTTEWSMRAIQGAFGRLHMPLNIINEEACSNLIKTCLQLYNLCAHWQATEDDLDVWRDFKSMLFSEQRKKVL
ncbi:hypothetical protein BDR06DRAFT_1055860 [Suillus hirtellus]|nr:hypothetical protein BDR06DRAFT_1055860 [Suillus hirtellus]